jgi:hypothetical protein
MARVASRPLPNDEAAMKLMFMGLKTLTIAKNGQCLLGMGTAFNEFSII